MKKIEIFWWVSELCACVPGLAVVVSVPGCLAVAESVPGLAVVVLCAWLLGSGRK